MNPTDGSYEAGLLEDLQDFEQAAAYVKAALEEENDDVVSMALQDCAKAWRAQESRGPLDD